MGEGTIKNGDKAGEKEGRKTECETVTKKRENWKKK